MPLCFPLVNRWVGVRSVDTIAGDVLPRAVDQTVYAHESQCGDVKRCMYLCMYLFMYVCMYVLTSRAFHTSRGDYSSASERLFGDKLLQA